MAHDPFQAHSYGRSGPEFEAPFYALGRQWQVAHGVLHPGAVCEPRGMRWPSLLLARVAGLAPIPASADPPEVAARLAAHPTVPGAAADAVFAVATGGGG